MTGSFEIAFVDVGPALVLAIPLVHIFRKVNIGGGWSVAAVAISIIAMGVPIFGITVGGYVRAYTGNLSILSIVILADHLARTAVGRELLERQSCTALLALAVAQGAMLYPWALGAAPIDPYSWGFSPIGLAGGVFACALLCWIIALRGAAIAVLLAVVTYHFRLYDSANLWDSLVDPWIVTFGMIAIVRTIVVPAFAHRSV